MSSFSTIDPGAQAVRAHSFVRRAAASAVALALFCSIGSRLVEAQTDTAAAGTGGPEEATYEQVRAIFKKYCLACHNDDRERGGLDLSTIEGIKAGGASGAVVTPGKPDESLLYTLAAQLETPKMPPNKPKIPQREIDLIRRWIEAGAFQRADPPGKSVPGTSAAPTPKAATPAAAPVATRAAAGLSSGVVVEPLRRATAVTALAASPKSPLVAVSGNKQVVLFSCSDGQPESGATALRALPFPEGDVCALRFSRDGGLLVAGGGVGGASGKAVVFEVETGKRLFEVGDELDAVLALDISPDKSLIALGGPGRVVKVFRTASGELTATLRKHTDWILSLAFSPDGLLLASGDRFGGLQVWEAESGQEFHTLRGHAGAVHALAWSADSDRLLSAGQDGGLRFWNMHTGELLTRWDGEVGGILSVDCDAVGRVVCGGRDRKVAVWDGPENRLQQFEMPDQVVKLAVNHDASQVIAGDASGNIAVFSRAQGQVAGRFTLPQSPAVAHREAPRLPRVQTDPDRNPAGPPDNEVARAEGEVHRATAHLARLREALASTEAAVEAGEESLKKLRESAEKLATTIADRESTVKELSRRAAELRKQSETARKAAASASLREQRERLRERLAEKQSLLDGARGTSERIQRATEKSPEDAGLKSSAKLATELVDKLAQDVAAVSDEIRRLEGPAGTAQN
jgi:hypothetical protein